MPLRTALPGKNASMHELRSTRIDARAISQGELLQVWKLTRTLPETACLSCACAAERNTTCAGAVFYGDAFPSPRCKMLILRYLLGKLWLWSEARDRGNPRWHAV